MKRKLITKAVIKIVVTEKPAAMRGKEASCAVPAKTNRLIAKACSVDSCDLPIARPVTNAQLKMATTEVDIFSNHRAKPPFVLESTPDTEFWRFADHWS